MAPATGSAAYLSVHEGPQRISKAPNRTRWRPGMIVSNEPGYYKPGAYGIRIENLVVVTKVRRAARGRSESCSVSRRSHWRRSTISSDRVETNADHRGVAIG